MNEQNKERKNLNDDTDEFLYGHHWRRNRHVAAMPLLWIIDGNSEKMMLQQIAQKYENVCIQQYDDPLVQEIMEFLAHLNDWNAMCIGGTVEHHKEKIEQLPTELYNDVMTVARIGQRMWWAR